MKLVKRLRWSELAQAPEGAGVYAWYCQPEITDRDLNDAISDVTQAMSANEPERAEAIVEALLNNKILNLFRQDPFEVTLTGPLKPRHKGSAVHEQRVSRQLIERMTKEPERLRSLRAVLGASAPDFASPIYIGMSDALRRRLQTHARHITNFRAQGYGRKDEPGDAVDNDEAGFAKRVVSRGITPERLFVMVCETGDDFSLHVDVENLFNRMYYPILGRN